MKNNFTEGKILPMLIKFSVPMVLALVLQALYGTVDLIIVGEFGDTASIAAVSSGAQVMNLVTNIIIGLTMGVTVCLGQYIGAKDPQKSADTIGTTIFVFGILSVVLSAVLLIFNKQILTLVNVPEQAFNKAIEYTMVCFSGIVFIVGYNLISGIFRGLGDSKSPLIFIAVACVVNVVLDLVFVGVLKMDALGAALATVIAQAVSVVFSLVKISKHGFPFAFGRENIKLNKARAKHMLVVGSPIALQNGLTSMSFLIITAIINNIGLVESAAIGIAEKSFVILSIVPMAFMTTLSAVVAQNIGANKKKRAFDVLLVGTAVSFAFSALMFIVAHFFGAELTMIFQRKDLAVIKATEIYLNASSYEYLIIGITFCLIGYMNGCGKTTFNMVQGLLVAFLVRIPLSLWFATMDNAMFMIGLSVPISAIVSLIACGTYMLILFKKQGIIGKNKENFNLN